MFVVVFVETCGGKAKIICGRTFSPSLAPSACGLLPHPQGKRAGGTQELPASKTSSPPSHPLPAACFLILKAHVREGGDPIRECVGLLNDRHVAYLSHCKPNL